MTLSAKKVKDILLIFKSATTYLGFKTEFCKTHSSQTPKRGYFYL